MHIRQVLVKAELEKYQQYKDVYTALKKGKVELLSPLTCVRMASPITGCVRDLCASQVVQDFWSARGELFICRLILVLPHLQEGIFVSPLAKLVESLKTTLKDSMWLPKATHT